MRLQPVAAASQRCAVGDGERGVQWAAATVSAGRVSSTLPLNPGLNTVVLHAKDVAGNSASAAIQVARTAAPTSLVITPSTRTMVMGESRVLKLADQTGTALTGATWTSSDTTIVSVSTDGSGTITALESGDVTVTAAREGLSATATVKVVSSLSAGTTR